MSLTENQDYGIVFESKPPAGRGLRGEAFELQHEAVELGLPGSAGSVELDRLRGLTGLREFEHHASVSGPDALLALRTPRVLRHGNELHGGLAVLERGRLTDPQ